MPPHKNNRLGSDYDLPMPHDFEGGSDDFSMLRIIDGHEAPIDGIRGFVGASGRNSHYPNSDLVDGPAPMGTEDEGMGY